MEIFGIRFLGLTLENGRKLLFSLALLLAVVLIRAALRLLARVVMRGSEEAHRARFWTHQGISLFSAALIVIGLVSVWFDDPARLTTALGLVTAGLAFALQKVITAIAGYFVILRGKNFTVGDRIVMGGVRGDVIALGFIQTTIMEMGQPPPVQSADPAVWVKSRQFTGRIVTVSNSQIFEEPIFNYTREFPYIWEEIALPITYKDDRKRAEAILLEAARNHALTPARLGADAAAKIERQFHVAPIDLEPTVYYRLTDNWLELTLRFVSPAHGTRHVKDAMSREIIEQLDAAGIGVASATFDIVGLPPVQLTRKSG